VVHVEGKPADHNEDEEAEETPQKLLPSGLALPPPALPVMVRDLRLSRNNPFPLAVTDGIPHRLVHDI